VKLRIEEARAHLKVDKHAIDDALEQQSVMLEAIHRQLAQENAALARCKRMLEVAEDKAMEDLARTHPELTNPQRERKAHRHDIYRDAHEEYITQKASVEEWEGLAKAWFNRGFDLRALADLHASQYFSQTTVSIHDDRLPPLVELERARSRIRQASEGVNEKRARRRVTSD